MDYRALSDEQLMGMVKQDDDEHAYEELRRRYGERSQEFSSNYIFRRYRMRDGEAADQAREAAWEIIWEKRRRYEEGRPFLPWFHTILEHECIHVMRQKPVSLDQPVGSETNGLTLGDTIESGREIGPSRNAEAAEETQEDWALLLRAFDRLTTPERYVFADKYTARKAVPRIAKRYGITEGYVLVHLCRARQKIAAYIRDELIARLRRWFCQWVLRAMADALGFPPNGCAPAMSVEEFLAEYMDDERKLAEEMDRLRKACAEAGVPDGPPVPGFTIDSSLAQIGHGLASLATALPKGSAHPGLLAAILHTKECLRRAEWDLARLGESFAGSGLLRRVQDRLRETRIEEKLAQYWADLKAQMARLLEALLAKERLDELEQNCRWLQRCLGRIQGELG